VPRLTGTHTRTVTDSAISKAPERFYRVILRPAN
jgi:hypothetical protein